MPFSKEQELSLLAQKWVGKTIISRLYEMGLDDVQKLADSKLVEVLERGSKLSGSTCWKNSPQAKQAIQNAIAWARLELKK
ncbi:MAG: recombinase RecA [Gammaproteobacteria bacterium]|nr:MAG: recombinase RecA [Gammaproteobacteria bacterium]